MRKKTAPGRPIEPPRIPSRLRTLRRVALADKTELLSVDLSGCDFSGRTAGSVTFEQVQLRGTRLERSRLRGLRMTDARIHGSDCSAGQWVNARFCRVEFVGCRMTGLELREPVMSDLLFRDCVMEGMILALPKIRSTRFERCSLRGALINGGEFHTVVFRHCDMTSMELAGTRLHEVDLRGSQIEGMVVDPDRLRGGLIDPLQAVYLATLFGINVRLPEDSETT